MPIWARRECSRDVVLFREYVLAHTGHFGGEPADDLVGPDGVERRPRRTLAQGAEEF